MTRTRPVLIAAAVVAVLIVAGSVAIGTNVADRVEVTASSTAPGFDARDLVHSDGDATAWRSEGEAEGTWVELTFAHLTSVDRLELRGPHEDGDRRISASVSFDSGPRLLVTSDDQGDAEISFAEQEVNRVRITFTDVADGEDAVALAGVALDGTSRSPAATSGPVTATASPPAVSSAIETAPLIGAAGTPSAATEWLADPADPAPWIELSWDSPRTVASVQVLGPSRPVVDPGGTAADALHGELVFGDGSRVTVSGIAAGDARPTTVAFMPRVVSSVRLELVKSITQATVGIRGFSVYDAGVTPPRTASTGGYTGELEQTVGCAADSDAVGQSDDLALVCPATGTAVDGEATIVVEGRAGAAVDATARAQFADGNASGSNVLLDSVITDASGRASVTFDASTLPHGPFAVRFDRRDAPDDSPALYVQLFNLGGQRLDSPGFAPDGMTLQWDEQFTEPLSISRTGDGSEYAATKPAYWGPSEFGDATFADPSDGLGNIATVDGDYLRIGVQPRQDGETGPWGQRHFGGSVSSAHIGGAGFSAQYGYFEARILGAPGRGAWPAFWMLDTENATNRLETSGEIDAVELYGHDTRGSCHSLHNWIDGEDVDDVVNCTSDNGFGDWAMGWHTYGVEVMPTEAVYYIDGVEVARADGLRSHDYPYYFMLDLALGGGWPVELEATGETTQMFVDWIRVYT